ncbi:MAG: hypothetical protein DME33_01365 [Verrucomicrobia bacterium]|nr:MAG: hypothetical protein DME33_01365 [Verrucomicrobiota bacterium]
MAKLRSRDKEVDKSASDGAIADVNRALQLNPRNAKAYDDRGLAKLSSGDLDSALADFNHALQSDPKLAPAYESRGVAKAIKGDLDSAVADYNRAIELNPKLPGAYLNRGIAKAYKGDTDNAIADINRALNINPKLAAAYASRGSANFLARNWTAALQDYRRFCELSPRSQQYARFGIWMIRSRLGEREAADKELAAQFNAKGKDWPSKIQRYLLGNLSESEFLAAVSPDRKIGPDQRCEAWFYAGMKNLLDGNKSAASGLFEKCAAGPKNVSEHAFAKAELKALGQ